MALDNLLGDVNNPAVAELSLRVIRPITRSKRTKNMIDWTDPRLLTLPRPRWTEIRSEFRYASAFYRCLSGSLWSNFFIPFFAASRLGVSFIFSA